MKKQGLVINVSSRKVKIGSEEKDVYDFKIEGFDKSISTFDKAAKDSLGETIEFELTEKESGGKIYMNAKDVKKVDSAHAVPEENVPDKPAIAEPKMPKSTSIQLSIEIGQALNQASARQVGSVKFDITKYSTDAFAIFEANKNIRKEILEKEL